MTGGVDKISNPASELVGPPSQQEWADAVEASKPKTCEEKALSTYAQCSMQAYKYVAQPTPGSRDFGYSFVPVYDYEAASACDMQLMQDLKVCRGGSSFLMPEQQLLRETREAKEAAGRQH